MDPLVVKCLHRQQHIFYTCTTGRLNFAALPPKLLRSDVADYHYQFLFRPFSLTPCMPSLGGGFRFVDTTYTRNSGRKKLARQHISTSLVLNLVPGMYGEVKTRSIDENAVENSERSITRKSSSAVYHSNITATRQKIPYFIQIDSIY